MNALMSFLILIRFNRATLIVPLVLISLTRYANCGLVTREVNVTLNAANIESYDLDVDLNGTPDFTFTAALIIDPFLSVGFDVVDFPFGGNNGVIIDTPTINGFPTASLLMVGDTVSAGDTFSLASFDQGNLFFFTSFDPPSGNFEDQSGFLGLRFDGTGGIFYGFAQITVNGLNALDNPLGITIGTVGFNDTPQGPAVATTVPEPSSILLIGMGGLLAACWRHSTNQSVTSKMGK